MSKLAELFMSQSLGEPYIMTTENLVTSIFFTLCLAGVMFFTYRLCHDSLTYNRKFNITLVMLAFLSTILLALIQNNPLLSLGVLGSLSICRIRTNTRDPRDLGFVFWALTIGISSAVGAFTAGLTASVFLAALMVGTGWVKKQKNVLTIVVRGEKGHVGEAERIIEKRTGSTVQCKNIFANSFELVYELRVKHAVEEEIVTELNAMEGIHGVNILAPETKVA